MRNSIASFRRMRNTFREAKDNKMVNSFMDIDMSLLNDMSDRSSITLDGIVLGSCNSFELTEEGNISDDDQMEIHETIKQVFQILSDYRDGKLVYKNDTYGT